MANLSNINNKFLVTTGGNVGINTTSPDSKLDVTGGDITVNTTATGFMNFKYSNSQMGTIGTDGVDLKITANADLQILPASNVGIGTSSPGRKLTIGNGNGFVNNQISLLDGGGTEQATIAVETTTANDLLIASKANLRFFTGSTIGNTTTLPTNERMRITSSGNVGIGTASPTSILHLQGLGGNDLQLRLATSASTYWDIGRSYQTGHFEITEDSGDTYFLINKDSGNVGIGTTSPTLGKLQVVSATGNVGFNAGTSSSPERGNLYFDTDGTGWKFNIGKSQSGTFSSLMTFHDNGNVGIGTTSPVAKFEVTDGSSSITLQEYTNGAAIFLDGVNGDFIGGDYFHILADGNSYLGLGGYGGGATPLNVANSGNVGIGTTSPTRQLHLKRTSGDVRGIMVETTVAASYAEVQVKAAREFRIGTGGSSSDSNASDRFYIFDATAAAHRFTISSTGNVGIGTTSPAQKVEIAGGYLKFSGGDYGIQGSASLTYNPVSDHYFQASGSTKVTIKASGNVGIGTASPGQKLHINGAAMKITDGTYGGFIGKGSALITTAAASDLAVRSEANMVFSTGGSAEKMRIDSSGNSTFAKNISVTDGTLTLNKSDGSLVKFVYNNTTRGYIGSSRQLFIGGLEADMGYLATGDSVFGAGGAERMRITSGGDVLISKTSASFTTQGIELRENGQINVAGTVDEFNFYNTSAAAYRFFVTAAGSVHATSTSIVAISDITLKENIKPLETGLNEVMKLKPRRFDWKNGDGKNIAGFIAQEVEEVLPDLVSDYKYTDEETKKALKMGDMIPTLVKSIQELKAEIELLKSK